jgi:hypothetical protein
MKYGEAGEGVSLEVGEKRVQVVRQASLVQTLGVETS